MSVSLATTADLHTSILVPRHRRAVPADRAATTAGYALLAAPLPVEVALHNAGGTALLDAGGSTAHGVRGVDVGLNVDHAAPPATADAERDLRTDAEIVATTADALNHVTHVAATVLLPVDPDKVPGNEVARVPVTEAGVRGAGAGLSAAHAVPRLGIAPLRPLTDSAQAGGTAHM